VDAACGWIRLEKALQNLKYRFYLVFIGVLGQHAHCFGMDSLVLVDPAVLGRGESQHLRDGLSIHYASVATRSEMQ
jgi:hypothetical protein